MDDQDQKKITEEIQTEDQTPEENTEESQTNQSEPVPIESGSEGSDSVAGGAEERSQASTAVSETNEDAPHGAEPSGPKPEIPERQDPQAASETSEPAEEAPAETEQTNEESTETPDEEESPAKWYVVHTYSGHENKVAAALKQRVESEHLEEKIVEVLVPTQEKIEIRGGKKETVREKIFPGYILVKMILDDDSWLAVRTTQGVTSFIGMGSKPTPIPDYEVKTIVNFMQQGGQPTYKQIFSEGDTVKIVDGPFAEFIGKIDSVDKERGKVKVLVSIFGRETPVELDFLQVAKL